MFNFFKIYCRDRPIQNYLEIKVGYNDKVLLENTPIKTQENPREYRLSTQSDSISQNK